MIRGGGVNANASGDGSVSGNGNFTENAKERVRARIGPSKNLILQSEHRILLPLCAVSVLQRAMENNDGIHNEDRWWLTDYNCDTGIFAPTVDTNTMDMEDIGDFLDNLKGMHFDRQAHVKAHAGAYLDNIAERKKQGYAPLLTPSCKAMNNLKFERSERRASFCPYSSINRPTKQHIEELLRWQSPSIRVQQMDAISDLALAGDQIGACLAHYNTMLRIDGRNRPLRKKPNDPDNPDKPAISRPSFFTQGLAMRLADDT
jgi:hypothetical protein